MNLYYYTRVETMRYILMNANIFATNIKYMNDSEEYANGLKELYKIYESHSDGKLVSSEKIEAELEKDIPIYSISFSGARDLLSQWSMYAGESGVSIKMQFDGTEKYKVYDLISGKRKRLVDGDTSIKPQKVWYCTEEAMNPDDYKRVTDEIWKEAFLDENDVVKNDTEGNFGDYSRKITPYIKRAEFQAEQEYRIVFEKSKWRNTKCDFRIDYRNSRNVLKPYLDVFCKNGWPIHEIIIGPGFNQKVVFESVRHFLNNAKLSVPTLGNDAYLMRFEEYLELCGTVPKCIKDLYEQQKEEIANAPNIHRFFTNIRNSIIEKLEMENVDNDFLEKISKTEFTKPGIILSRSRIPYIFEN